MKCYTEENEGAEIGRKVLYLSLGVLFSVLSISSMSIIRETVILVSWVRLLSFMFALRGSGVPSLWNKVLSLDYWFVAITSFQVMKYNILIWVWVLEVIMSFKRALILKLYVMRLQRDGGRRVQSVVLYTLRLHQATECKGGCRLKCYGQDTCRALVIWFCRRQWNFGSCFAREKIHGLYCDVRILLGHWCCLNVYQLYLSRMIVMMRRKAILFKTMGEYLVQYMWSERTTIREYGWRDKISPETLMLSLQEVIVRDWLVIGPMQCNTTSCKVLRFTELSIGRLLVSMGLWIRRGFLLKNFKISLIYLEMIVGLYNEFVGNIICCFLLVRQILRTVVIVRIYGIRRGFFTPNFLARMSISTYFLK